MYEAPLDSIGSGSCSDVDVVVNTAIDRSVVTGPFAMTWRMPIRYLVGVPFAGGSHAMLGAEPTPVCGVATFIPATLTLRTGVSSGAIVPSTASAMTGMRDSKPTCTLAGVVAPAARTG